MTMYKTDNSRLNKSDCPSCSHFEVCGLKDKYNTLWHDVDTTTIPKHVEVSYICTQFHPKIVNPRG